MDENREINIKMIAKNWRAIMFFVGVFSAVAFFVSTVITPQYGSEAQILILQKNIDIDAYRASKSSEFASEVLKRVVSSSDFMNGALEKANENVSKFGEDPEDQIKNWNKAVSVSTFASTGIIKITVLDESKKENRKIMEAVLGELLNNGVKYHGNENITLKKIGGPVYFNDPVFPIIWLNVLVATIVGLFFSIGMVFIFGEKMEEWFSKRNPVQYGGTFEYRRDIL